jgi:ligand-binding SRPBCC domain-containing protein
VYVLERRQVVPRSPAEVFPFFAAPENLGRITPSFLGFKILTPLPIDLRAGAVIDYRIKVNGIPMTWRTLIEAYTPNESFVDVQLKGPYKRWHHTHTFKEVPGGTELGDRVEYELPFGPLGRLVHRLVVARQLNTIFEYRAQVMRETFGAPSSQTAGNARHA